MSQHTKVVIIGGKGTAVNIAEQITDAHQRFGSAIEVLGFAIDDPSLGSAIAGFPILCRTREVAVRFPQSDVGYIFALYKPSEMLARVRLLQSYGLPAERFATFVHPQSYCARTAQLGAGTVVLSHSVIQSNARIGNFSLISSHAVIEHDAAVGECNFIAASACVGASVKLGEGVFTGLAASIRENVHVANYGFIGMGSVVIRDVDEGAIVAGNPAHTLTP